MDVLKTTAPFQMHCGPWQDQLDPTVRRLLLGSPSSRSRTLWEELSELLSLLLRMKLLQTKRILGLHFGEFGDPASAKETAEPDLHVQFHHFWAVLFQPPMESTFNGPKNEES
ncbi:hypothetical protein PENANT_c001G05753 [Penicillium antarcticum]|uniref:Uncharacterized protein n=1 Tax=Penicillium antarcticum TaxID=416450 RepID=A0A1V6QPB5_9EURO|nr:hypothetical protein PENANT_c001G05753 [Penicillium antarcticum]